MSSAEYPDQRYTSAGVLSVLFHIALGVLLVLNFDFSWQSNEPVVANVIDAVVVDSGILKKIEQDKQRELAREKQQRRQERQRREQEAIRIAKEKQEQQRQAEEKLRLEKQRKEEQQRLEEQRLAEQKRIEEQQRLEQQRIAEEEQRRQEQLAEEQRLLEEAKQAEWDRLREAEEAALAQARSTELATKRALYRQAITQKVERNWIKPASALPEYTCRVNVKQIPGGEVVSVRIVSCDADASFERSVENAVYKASPLPDPPDPQLFEREINFTFRPGE